MSRQPDYILKVMDKVTDARSGKLGCAWANDDDSLTIMLDPGASIAYGPNLVVKLFRNDVEGVKQNAKIARTKRKAKMDSAPTPPVAGMLPPGFFKGNQP